MANEFQMALADIEAVAKKVLEGIAPTLETMVNAAVGAAVPSTIAPAAAVVLDTVDTLVNANNPSLLNAASQPNATVAAAPVVTAEPTMAEVASAIASLTQQVTALTAHVAALTIVTGNDTSSAMQLTKASVQATQTAQAVAAAKAAAPAATTAVVSK